MFYGKKEKNLLEKFGFEVVSIIGTPCLNFMSKNFGSKNYLNGSVRSMMGHDIIFVRRKIPPNKAKRVLINFNY